MTIPEVIIIHPSTSAFVRVRRARLNLVLNDGTEEPSFAELQWILVLSQLKVSDKNFN